MKLVHTSNGQLRTYTGKYTVKVQHTEKDWGVIPCDICDEDFNRNSGSAKYCPHCKTKLAIPKGRTSLCGPASPCYKHGLKAAKRRKKKFCEGCGELNNLQLHHKDRNRQNNDDTNLETLCAKCHTAEHIRLGTHPTLMPGKVVSEKHKESLRRAWVLRKLKFPTTKGHHHELCK